MERGEDMPVGATPAIGSRRTFIAGLGSTLVGASASALGKTPFVHLPFDNGDRPLVLYPQKRPLIGQTSRPPQLETPFSVFAEGPITPNDAFFVRYHLANLPLDVDAATFRLAIGGHVETPISLSLDQLKRDFPTQEIAAVNQCSGNSRGFFSPRVGGGQLGNGAMGNARWRGVSLKALLDHAGVRAGAVDVSFNGLDEGPLETLPDFVKSLPVDHARDGEVMVAWAMNGADLPLSERLSAATGRARPLWHLLGQAFERHPRARRHVRRLLDEECLSRARQ